MIAVPVSCHMKQELARINRLERIHTRKYRLVAKARLEKSEKINEEVTSA